MTEEQQMNRLVDLAEQNPHPASDLYLELVELFNTLRVRKGLANLLFSVHETGFFIAVERTKNGEDITR